MSTKVIRKGEVQVRANQLADFEQLTGTQPETSDIELGPSCVIWRLYRDGCESFEQLPLWLGELTIAAIPECEPEVARARLLQVQESPIPCKLLQYEASPVLC
jgi:hypothetical protein